MRLLSNLHIHTTFSDGKSSMEEYIKTAVLKGYRSLGFSDHTRVDPELYKTYETFNETLYKEDYTLYYNKFCALKEKYKDSIDLYIGLENDYLPYEERPWLDYTIGSVHNFFPPGEDTLYCVDGSQEELAEFMGFYGSEQEFVKAYYDRYAYIMETYKPDIGAHFDLIVKFNRGDKNFSTSSGSYVNTAGEALQRIKNTGVIIEVNTGAMSRGRTDCPYPKANLLGIIRELEIPVTISADAHNTGEFEGYFDEALSLIKNTGFKSIKQLYKGSFIDMEI